MNPDRLRQCLQAVAGLTLMSGAAQTVAPAVVLGTISPERNRTARHLFGTVGMFMTVSGGTLHRAVSAPEPDRGLLAWAAAQKLGASVAVGIGVRRHLFARRALAVAAFDLASGVACLAYRRRPPTAVPAA